MSLHSYDIWRKQEQEQREGGKIETAERGSEGYQYENSLEE